MNQEINIITQVFLPVSLAIIMFSMGLTLTLADFKRVFLQPKAFLLGAFSQMIILPLVAFLLVFFWPLPEELAVGLMILAACPGGVVSNMMTHLAKGDSALSISLTAVISIASVLTIPFIVNFSLTHFIDQGNHVTLPLGSTIIGIFMITTVPVLIGMWIKNSKSQWTDRIEPQVRKAASLLFLIVVLGAIAKERQNILGYFVEAGLITLTLNMVMMLLAFYLARIYRLNQREGIAITLECGLQNGTLAIFVSLTLLENTTMMIPAAIYSLLMFVTGGGFVFISRKQFKNNKLIL